jgi:hypothetical protein
MLVTAQGSAGQKILQFVKIPEPSMLHNENCLPDLASHRVKQINNQDILQSFESKPPGTSFWKYDLKRVATFMIHHNQAHTALSVANFYSTLRVWSASCYSP